MGASLSALNITAGTESSSTASSLCQLKQLGGFHSSLDLKPKPSKSYYRHLSVSARTHSVAMSVENEEPVAPLITTRLSTASTDEKLPSEIIHPSSNVISSGNSAVTNSSAGRLTSSLSASLTNSKNSLAQHFNLSFVNTATLKKLINAGTLHRTKPSSASSVGRPQSEYVSNVNIPPHIPYYGYEKGPTNLDLAVSLIDQLHLLSTNTNNRHSTIVNNKHSTSPPPKERFKQGK